MSRCTEESSQVRQLVVGSFCFCLLLAWEEKLVPCLGGLWRWVVAWCFDSGERRWDRRNQDEDDDPGVRACASFGLRGAMLCPQVEEAKSTMEATALCHPFSLIDGEDGRKKICSFEKKCYLKT
jgi:hypothetical protein